jgi:hypothetical protein
VLQTYEVLVVIKAFGAVKAIVMCFRVQVLEKVLEAF